MEWEACLLLYSSSKLVMEYLLTLTRSQTVDNDLQQGRCPASSIVCLVIDEAHRATGNYAYVKLVCPSLLPQLLILVACRSPGSQKPLPTYVFLPWVPHQEPIVGRFKMSFVPILISLTLISSPFPFSSWSTGHLQFTYLIDGVEEWNWSWSHPLCSTKKRLNLPSLFPSRPFIS